MQIEDGSGQLVQARIKWAGTGANEKPSMMWEFGSTLDVLVSFPLRISLNV